MYISKRQSIFGGIKLWFNLKDNVWQPVILLVALDLSFLFDMLVV